LPTGRPRQTTPADSMGKGGTRIVRGEGEASYERAFLRRRMTTSTREIS